MNSMTIGTQRDTHEVERVAIFAALRSPGLGDLLQRNILSTLAAAAYPSAEIVLVVDQATHRRHGRTLAAHTTSDAVLACPSPDREPTWRNILKEHDFDLCVVDPGSAELTARHAAEIGIVQRIGVLVGGPQDKYLTAGVRPRASIRGRTDLLDYATAMAEALGLDRPSPGSVLPRMPNVVATPGCLPRGPGPSVVLHPGGARLWNRRWPMTSYAELGSWLAHLPTRIVLMGDADEGDELRLLEARIVKRDSAVSVCVVAGVDLREAAGIIAAADLLVGNDSSLGHVAAAVGTPSVILYGPTGTEFMWTRIYPRHRGVSLHMRCQGRSHEVGDLGSAACPFGCTTEYRGVDGPYPRCLSELPVQSVIDAVGRQLASYASDESESRVVV